MVVLKIFNEQDKDKETPLSTFEVGEHVIGRGSFANCSDKKISRRHIVINVKENEATLTSVHVSPIFFMSNNSKHIQMMKKDNTVTVADGDKFAFLIETWYIIKIEEAQVNNDNITGSGSSVVPISKPVSSNTIIPSNSNTVISQSTSCKRMSDTSYSEERKKLKLLNESLDKLEDNIDKIVSLDYNSNGNDESNKQKDTTEVFRGNDISDSGDEDSDVDLGPELTQDVEIVNGVQNKSEENVESHDTVDGVKQSEILDDVKKEPMIEDDNVLIIKIEPQEDATEHNNDHAGNLTEQDSVTVKDEIETHEEKPENSEIAKINDTADTTASSSGTSNRVRRDKCWYGQNCYRKNRFHRNEFSHPGDSDHEDDPDDNRPQCPYGALCYRKNTQHRRDYKHPTSRPAPGPSTSKRPNIQVYNIFNGICPLCNHCRQKQFGGGKDDPNSGPDKHTLCH